MYATLFSLRWPTLMALLVWGTFSCQQSTQAPEETASSSSSGSETLTLLDDYVRTVDPAFSYEKVYESKEEGYTLHVIRMVSQRWLTENEVENPEWWHWLTVVVPDQLQASTSLLFIGGGSRGREQPNKADDLIVQTALATGTVVTELHNVPNQPMTFIGDDFGPREEDQLIAYGWRKFLEGGAKDADAIWLARLPMTAAAVRAMDVVQEVSQEMSQPIDSFVVAGGSKRGWTTWTTAAVDDRVMGIVPIVIDLLNVVPSFEHHWKAYGFWAPAVREYEDEGIMEWQGSREYQRLLEIVEPYSYIERLDMPKLLVNATGDQFFLPDSWQFYWDDLQGEKHVRYVANGEHSLRETDAIQSLISFYGYLVRKEARPDFDWEVKDGQLVIRTDPDFPPREIRLWQATNPETRDFRVSTIDRSWTSTPVVINNDGTYSLKVEEPEAGWTAFMAELTFPGVGDIPLKISTGVVVTPDELPHPPFQAAVPMGTPLEPAAAGGGEN